MKQILWLVCIIFLAGAAEAGTKCGKDDPYNPFATVTLKLHNLVPRKNLKPGQFVDAKENVGMIRELPEKVTEHADIFKEGQAAYDRGEYPQAAAYFLIIFEMEPENPFVINALERSLYQIKGRGDQARVVYLKLMEVIEKGYLDSEKNSVSIHSVGGKKTEETIVIDPWFIEANWKLGTLYLDTEEYREAVLELSKLYFFRFKAERDVPPDDRAVAARLFGFLTEAYFHLNEKPANQYFACRTREIDPENTYINEFLLKE